MKLVGILSKIYRREAVRAHCGDVVKPYQCNQLGSVQYATFVLSYLGHSYVGACLGLIVSLLYKCGSLLYLAATAMLCLDVVILHWYVHVGDQLLSRQW